MTIHIKIPNDDLFIAMKEKTKVPKNTSGIYKFYGEDKHLLYVGKASDLRQRISLHLSGKDATTEDIFHNFKFVACIFVKDPVDREIYETYMINALKPLLNWNKVFTYQSQKYNPLYNPNSQIRDQESEKRINEAMQKFRI